MATPNWKTAGSRRLAWAAILLIASACSTADTSATLTPLAVPSETASSTPTPIVAPTTQAQLHTTVPTRSLTLTQTSSATRAPSTTTTPTWTPLPTLEPNAAQAKVTQLLEDNGGCRLPCWWGIIPDETYWDTAQHFQAAFAASIEQGASGFATEGGVTFFEAHYEVTYPISGDTFGGRNSYTVRDGVIVFIHVGRSEAQLIFPLRQLLDSYGRPTEVLLKTYTNAPEAYLPFRIAVSYPEQGILAYYEYPALEVGDKMQGCPDATGPELWLWAPAKKTVPRSVIEPPDTNNPLRALDEVTDIDIEDFYQTFKAPNAKGCIETPARYWP
jgi:hypothetical protein